MKKFLLFLGAFMAVGVVSGATAYWLAKGQFDGPQNLPGTVANQTQAPAQNQDQNQIVKTGSKYKSVKDKPSGWFESGQEADILLSGVDFNNAGGGLLFNHPGAVVSDGERLYLADRNNNRVLVWNKLPQKNEAPDLVLGQPDFAQNNPGEGLNNLNWPVAVWADNKHVIVGDTYNDRILIWNSPPTQNGQPADIEIRDENSNASGGNAKRKVGWVWAVWSDGQKLVVTSTASSAVLIWNTFPTQNNQAADIYLTASGKFGTPRSIGSDGKRLVIGDHNAKVNNDRGNFIWKTFPTKDDQAYDLFVADAPEEKPPLNSANMKKGEIFYGNAFLPGGKYMNVTNVAINIWNKFIESENDTPDVQVGGSTQWQSNSGFKLEAGDGSGAVYAGNTLYISLSNGNKIVAYKKIPETGTAEPDFAVGAQDIKTNTLQTGYIMSNPIPATDGKSLFVSSDFDRKLYVYKNLPDESGAEPDFVYPYGGWDSDILENTFVMAGNSEIYIWKSLPTQGQEPDTIIDGSIGGINLNDIKGIALDRKYFYVSSKADNKVYVWDGIPEKSTAPKFSITTSQPQRLSSDGNYLVVTATEDNENGHVRIYKIDGLSADSKPAKVLDTPNSKVRTNLPQLALAQKGSLFVSDTNFNRVLIWKSIGDAVAGKEQDTILGAKEISETPKSKIGKSTLFWPAGLAFDGSFLWVGEFKFSERLLRFSVK